MEEGGQSFNLPPNILSKVSTMTRVYRFYCGTDTNGFDVDAVKIAHDLAAKYFPNGHTVFNANGRWTGEVGVIDEPTIVIEWMATDQQVADGSAHKLASKFAGMYKNHAYQEAVLVTSYDVSAAFV